MLSATNTIDDVKARLINPYSFYGFASDGAYETFLTSISVEVELLDMWPTVGEALYATIEAKDKTGLTTFETYIYWAEVFFIAYRLTKAIHSTESQAVKGSGYSHSVGDVSESTSGAGSSGMRTASSSYYKTANAFLIRAGYPVGQLTRGGTPTENEYFPDAVNNG